MVELLNRRIEHTETDDFAIDLFPYKVKNRKLFYHRDHPKNLSPHSFKYKKYWYNDFLNPCLEGKWVFDKDEDNKLDEGTWVYIPPKLFFYVNYPFIVDKRRNPVNAYLRDNEWIIFTYLLCAEGFSGFEDDDKYTCNRYLKKLIDGKKLTDFDKKKIDNNPFLKKPNGEWKEYVDPWIYLTEVYLITDKRNKPLGRPIVDLMPDEDTGELRPVGYSNGYYNVIILAARTLGKSFSVFIGEFLHEWIFGDVRRFEDRADMNKPALYGIASSDSAALGKTLEAFERAYNLQPGMYDYPKKSQAKSEKSKKRWGAYYKKFTGSWKTTSRSSIIHELKSKSPQQKPLKGGQAQVQIIQRSDVKAFTGDRYKRQYIEEVGFQSNLKSIYASAKDAILVDGEWVGQLIMLGTGGDMEAIREPKEIFENPELYNIFPIPNYWEKGNKKCGLFLCTLYKGKNRDNDGNTDLKTELFVEIAKRIEEKKQKSILDFSNDLMWNPLYPKELLRPTTKLNIPKSGIQDHLRDLTAMQLGGGSYFEKFSSIGTLEDSVNGIYFKSDFSGNLEPILKYGDEEKIENKNGAWIIYEAPMLNAPEGLYYILIDPIRRSIGGSSLQAIYVYKSDYAFDNEGMFDTIVASFVGRRDNIDDGFYEAIKAASYYNGKIFSENNAEGFAEYVLRKNYEHFMLPTPWNSIALSRGITPQKLRKSGYQFGYDAHERTNIWNLYKLGEWLNKEIEWDKDGICILRNYHRIKDPRFLSELVSFEIENKTNFDAVSAMMGLPLILANTEGIEIEIPLEDDDDPYDKYSHQQLNYKPRPMAKINQY
jgi:hypothetical protein